MKTCTCHWGLVYSNGFGKAARVGPVWKTHLNLSSWTQNRDMEKAHAPDCQQNQAAHRLFLLLADKED